MNWKKEPLGKICKTTSGGTPSRKNQSYYQNGTIPWVKSGELENNIITTSEEFITEEGLLNSSAKIFPAGTLLIALYGATIGKLAFLGIDAATNQAVCGIFQNENVSLKYLYYYLLFQRPNLIKQGVGGAQPNISQTILKKLEISYPDSITEQQRIIARIEELFSELDKAVDTLKTTKEQLEVYRQAVLVDAFRVATNSTHLKIGYVCAKIVDCPHSTPKWEKNGKLCLRTTNFKRGYLDLQSPNYVSEETFNDRNRRIIPQPGDVLYSREGSVLGIACTIPSNVYPCLGQRMMLLRSGEKLNNRYLMHYLNSPMVTNHVIATKGGTGSPHINVGDIKEFQIPIPSLEEQSNIVRQIEEQLSSCDNIEKTVDAILTQADAMRQSILKQAFEE